MTRISGLEFMRPRFADRIIDDEVARWLDTGFATALAGLGDLGDEPARRVGIEEMQHLHLAGHEYALVPRIVDALTRAGLLTKGT